MLLIKLSSTLEDYIAKYQKLCEISWSKLGMGYLCHLGYPWRHWKLTLKIISHIHYDITRLPFKIMNGSQCFHRDKICTR